MSGDDLLGALQVLISLDHRDRARNAAERLPGHLAVADLLRAADGVQQVARELSTLRADPDDAPRHDPHDIRSLYT